MFRTALLACLAAVAVLSLAGCAAPPGLADRDVTALDVLGEVAGPTSGVVPDAITGTQCWIPSDHPIEEVADSGTLWRVLCRVQYTDDSGERYQDTTCIGDFAADPMLDHCYRWTHYDFAEVFEDHPAVVAG